MARAWTDEQSLAIETRDRTLLISAAAGSGKTATLTERIIRSLLDEREPASISRLLIVTFTNAAVGELRSRIDAALRQSLVEHPGDARLEEQLRLLPGAKICTIDSFCNDLLKKNTEAAGVPAGYRIADTAEAALLANSVAEDLISAIYAGECPAVACADEFASAVDPLTSAKEDEVLADRLLELYEATESLEGGVRDLLPLVEVYNPEKYTGFDNTPYGKYIVSRVRECAEFWYGALSRATSEIPATPDTEKYLDFMAKNLAILEKIRDSDSYAAISSVMAERREVGRAPAMRGEKRSAEYLAAEDCRGRMKADLDAEGDYLFFSEETIRDVFAKVYRTLSVTYRFLIEFDTSFRREKLRRGMCQYSDIERYACSLLWDGDEPSELAKSLRNQYTAVYIDEYQDVDRLQNKIFRAVAREDNRFMVGDIKQSIYSFRSADPTIFAEMKKSYREIRPGEDAGAPEPSSIFMSRNFRCDREVIDVTNAVFDRMFGVLGDSIGYTGGDRLVMAKVQERRRAEHPTEIHILEGKPRAGAERQETDADDLIESEESYSLYEARYVARLVAKILREERRDDGRAVSPGDIAVILRSARSRAEDFREAMERCGLAAGICDDTDFFLNPEILLALALLNVIDNPQRDVYLASVLCSPLFGFTPDELIDIRSYGEDVPLYTSLCTYAEETGDEKAKKFLRFLDRYRAVSEGIEVSELISKLYRETGLYPLAVREGGGDNLRLLLDYARSFGGSSYKGLYSFISYINNVIAQGRRIEAAKKEVASDPTLVKIITAHSSKGLEYPICILAGAGSSINDADAKKKLVYDRSFGLSLCPRTNDGLALLRSPSHLAVIRHKKELNYEEELRILYVAMTRASEQLYIVGGTGRSSLDKFTEDIAWQREHFTAYTARRLGSFLKISAVCCGTDGKLIPVPYDGGSAGDGEITPEKAYTPPDVSSVGGAAEEVRIAVPEAGESPFSGAAEETPEYDEGLRDTLISRFTYAYPRAALTSLPEKISVSRLYPEVLDDADSADAAALTVAVAEGKRGVLPSFYTGRREDESRLRGIATHMLLQFCDLERLAKGSAAEELTRLSESGFLTKEDAELVRIDEIEKFRRSTLFSDMRRAKHLYRELRFNVRLPARDFTDDEERREALTGEHILVQGVIDCIIENEDGTLTLVDYKTDRMSREEEANPALADKTLREKHEKQLSYYAEAVKLMFGRAPMRTEIYSLQLGRSVYL